MRPALLAVLAFVILSGCHQPTDTIPVPPVKHAREPPDIDANATDLLLLNSETNQTHIQVDGGRTVAAGGSSGISETRRVVVANPSAWEGLWREHESRRSPAIDPPAIDFDSERLIAAWAGDRPNTCHEIRITSVTFDTATNTTTVQVEESGPEQSACFQAITQPFHVVASAADGTDVVFLG